MSRSASWLSEMEEVVQRTLLSSYQTFRDMDREESFFRGLVEKEKASRAEQRSTATQDSLARRIRNANKYRVCKKYLEAKSVLERSGNLGQYASASWDDPTWDAADDHLSSAKELFEARAQLVRFRDEEDGELPTTDESMREWIASTEGRETEDWLLWLNYDEALDDLEIKCFDRVEALKKREERMNYLKRCRSSVSVNIRVKDAVNAYKRYEVAYNRLPNYNTPFKIPANPWDSNDMWGLFSQARDGRAFLNEDWAKPEYREGIKSLRALDCAIIERANLEVERGNLESWMIHEVEVTLGAMSRLDLSGRFDSLWNSGLDVLNTVERAKVLTLCRLIERYGHVQKAILSMYFRQTVPWAREPDFRVGIEQRILDISRFVCSF